MIQVEQGLTISATDLRMQIGAALEAALRGEAVTVTRYGRPIARLVAIPRQGMADGERQGRAEA